MGLTVLPLPQNAETMLHDLEAQHDRVGGGGGNAGKPDDDEELEEQGSADSVGGGAPAQSHEETVHQHRSVERFHLFVNRKKERTARF